jgi:hypothetical protein
MRPLTKHVCYLKVIVTCFSFVGVGDQKLSICHCEPTVSGGCHSFDRVSERIARVVAVWHLDDSRYIYESRCVYLELILGVIIVNSNSGVNIDVCQ